MEKKFFFYNNKWSIKSIRTEADLIINFKSKIRFLLDIIKLIKKSKPKGAPSLSVNATITIKKVKQYIDQLEQENLSEKEITKKIVDQRANFTGHPDSLIDIFYQLKNNHLGKDNRPLLDEPNHRIAELILNTFKIDLSITTVIDKLSVSKTHLRPDESSKEKIKIIKIKEIKD